MTVSVPVISDWSTFGYPIAHAAARYRRLGDTMEVDVLVPVANELQAKNLEMLWPRVLPVGYVPLQDTSRWPPWATHAEHLIQGHAVAYLRESRMFMGRFVPAYWEVSIRYRAQIDGWNSMGVEV